jgi:uncharacterized membrane protein YfcA
VDPLESFGLFAATALIGAVSAVLGLGGGLFLVPLLLLGLGLEPREAVPVSLVCTVATSAAGSVALDKARLSDASLVVLMELPAALGSILGAMVLSRILPQLAVVGAFATLVLYAAWRMLQKARGMSATPEDEEPFAGPTRVPLGMAGFGLAGVASGVLGIGGGPIKVPMQTEVMEVPLKVALANSNLMVGITAAVGAAAYYGQGALDVGLLGPCALGISLGAYGGGRVAPRLPVRPLAYAFGGILILLGGKLAWKAIELAG